MRDQLIRLLTDVLADMKVTDVSLLISRPDDSNHGDYTTNLAMVLAKKIKRLPMEIAKEIQEAIIKHQKASSLTKSGTDLSWLEKVEIASPGFINFFLSEANFINQLRQVLDTEKSIAIGPKNHFQPQITQNDFRKLSASGEFAEKKLDRQGAPKKVMIEFADPNPFKEFHIGHLRNITLGESFSRLLEATGHEVRRVNYQGDVGMHVAKAIWGLQKLGDKDQMSEKSSKEKAEHLGKAYALGAKAFEEDDQAKKEIIEVNKKVYKKDPSIFPLWEEGRQWSLDYFDTIYDRVGTQFTRFYFESEVAPIGLAIVSSHIKDGVFEESDGAVVFRGENVGLHTRVFISKEGYATYEAKDLALAPLKYSEYPYDLSIIMTGNEQSPYFAVMLAALKKIHPELAAKTRHMPFGMVNLAEGKMSSRKGNVITADWLINQAKRKIRIILQKNKSNYSKEDQEHIAEKAAIAAVKYSMLKVTAASDISFDLEKSVSFDGDSGPYLQYTYARCRSVLRKAGNAYDANISGGFKENEEHNIARLIGYFSEVVVEAAGGFSPNTICTYLFHLAQAFNLLYAKHEILGNNLRLGLTAATAHVLENGLYLLGIEALEQM